MSKFSLGVNTDCGRMEIVHKTKDGYVFLEIEIDDKHRLVQLSIDEKGDHDECRACVAYIELDAVKVAQMIAVFRGMQEECGWIVADRKFGDQRVNFRHIIEPLSGYILHKECKGCDGEDVQGTFILGQYEAIALCSAFEGVMSRLVFGLPEALDRLTI